MESPIQSSTIKDEGTWKTFVTQVSFRDVLMDASLPLRNRSVEMQYTLISLSDESLQNGATNFSDAGNDSLVAFDDTLPFEFVRRDVVGMAVTTVFLVLLILATVLGNVFVIAAILLEKNLQNVGNYLVLSLAVADLMVACLVMPIGAVYEVSQQWTMGPELCDIWTSFDVMCCTASILHLLAIAVDRYWAVTNVDYIHQRNARHICWMILIVWAVSFVVSFAPMVGWKDSGYLRRIELERRCLVSQDVAYQVFATFSSFYIPLVLILVLYFRIYQEAKKRIRRRPGSTLAYRSFKRAASSPPAPSATELTTTTVTNASSSNASSETPSVGNGNAPMLPAPDSNRLDVYPSGSRPAARAKRKRGGGPNKEAADECRREKKAAKTLAIITGVFVACWLPFFVIALLMPMCPACEPNAHLFSFFLWLGYANSMVNPIIYTIFSPDFRCAFRKMFRRGGKSRYRRPKR